MLIKASLNSDKTKILAEKYIEFLVDGVMPSEILVLTANAVKKEKFLNIIKTDSRVSILEKPLINSFFGLVYHTVNDFYPFVEEILPENNVHIIPNLVGLELSQYLFKNVIGSVGFQGYNSRVSLLHQMFRRHSLIVQNSLSDDEVEERSSLLKEAFSDDARLALRKFRSVTNHYRSFDYLRQCSAFEYLYKHSGCFDRIKYIIVDDADELFPFGFEFVKHLSTKVKEVFIAYDSKGTSRFGFLGGDIAISEKIHELFQSPSDLSLEPHSRLKNDAESIFDIVAGADAHSLKHFESYSYIKRIDMIEAVIESVKTLLQKGVLPSRITIVTPLMDDLLKGYLKNFFESQLISHQFLSGSEKLVENPLVCAIACVLKLHLGLKPQLFELRKLFSKFLKIPLKYSSPLAVKVLETGNFPLFSFIKEDYQSSYENFIKLLENLKNRELPLSEKILFIFNEFLLNKNIQTEEIEKFSFFVKQVQDFETVFPDIALEQRFQKEIVTQLESSIIAENPTNSPRINPDALIISTPQKIIDSEIVADYQLWLDVSSDDWKKEDIGPLYNAWVFSKSFDKKEFTYEYNIFCKRQKLARQLRKLVLCANMKILTFASVYDSAATENYGGVSEFLLIEGTKSRQKNTFNIVPRKDQEPVLAYENGEMAVAAVPGAGKTTILLALVMKLMNSGVNPSNIFVLTYMDSAARNFKERIKLIFKDAVDLPNISTIHGLCLRIIKENDNFIRVGLNPDFEIIDDNKRQKLIREILLKLGMEQELYDNYERAVSSLKLNHSSLDIKSENPELKYFFKFCKAYKSELNRHNCIDYDDMLVLALRLLEENPDILEFYQKIALYIIEDEAQDSSSLQQKLISLLSRKHKNLIRCGDVNQAITSTFADADVEGFKRFIDAAKSVKMTSQQRCAKNIYELANTLIDYSKQNEELKNAFFDIKMQGVTKEQEKSSEKLEVMSFMNYQDERAWIVSRMKNIFQTNKDATVAILLRYNHQIFDYSDYMSRQGFNVVSKGDCLLQNPVFQLVYAVLKFVFGEFRNTELVELMQVFENTLLYSFSEQDYSFVSAIGEEFVLLEEPIVEGDELKRLWWDLNYWIERSDLSFDVLSREIGYYYFENSVDKSNAYIVSLFVKRLMNLYKDDLSLIERMHDVASRPLSSGFKLFEDAESENKGLESKIQIMTYHKSKGAEFDYVFLPEMTAKNMPVSAADVSLRGNSIFVENIKSLAKRKKPSTHDSIKLSHIEENLRLFYVAVTRAKKSLSISVAEQYKKFGRLSKQKPSKVFDVLKGGN